MAEFSEVIRQAKRMCGAHFDCKDCALNQSTINVDCIGQKNSGHPPFNWDEAINSKFERIVMEWAKAHPEPRYPTWDEWQTANFPDGEGSIPPCRFVGKKEMNRINGRSCERISCWQCANNPIPADIAEKLGIKPIGGVNDENA